jgi:hypothetical protein
MIRRRFRVSIFLALLLFLALSASCSTWGLNDVLVCPLELQRSCQEDQLRCASVALIETSGRGLTGLALAQAVDKATRKCLKKAGWINQPNPNKPTKGGLNP